MDQSAMIEVMMIEGEMFLNERYNRKLTLAFQLDKSVNCTRS